MLLVYLFVLLFSLNIISESLEIKTEDEKGITFNHSVVTVI